MSPVFSVYAHRMGPNTLFDKSFLQGLSLDESVWFDRFYSPVIAPLFFVETLADLAKAPREGRSAEDEVAIIASKTPEWSGTPCYYHQHLCVYDLLGHPAPMTGQVPVAGASRVMKDGKIGAVINYPPEAKAFSRWQARRFLEIEQTFAHVWRERVQGVDLEGLRAAMKSVGVGPKACKSLADARRLAEWTTTGMTKSGGRFEAALDVLGIPSGPREEIKARWKYMGKPAFRHFAPYAAHVLAVEAFFAIAIGAHHIAAERASNKVDIAYLFYLPFCHIFVSSDRLHRACAPEFLRPDQMFAWGPDLKADLGAINDHFAALPEEQRSQPLYKLARSLPDELRGLTRDLSARYAPGNLSPEHEIDLSQMKPEGMAKLAAHVRSWTDAGLTPHGRPYRRKVLESISRA